MSRGNVPHVIFVVGGEDGDSKTVYWRLGLLTHISDRQASHPAHSSSFAQHDRPPPSGPGVPPQEQEENSC